MDKLIYTAMSGAKQAFMQQAGVANNLANASSTGYRAQEHASARFRFRVASYRRAPLRSMPPSPTISSKGR